MASNNSKKQVHVSPGIYFTESEISVATKSLGITNLGLVGETLKGPAFQPIRVSSWGQYQQYFGGTSTEKFRGSQYPKYELPYIAKTYLEESQSLQVCRVLGLSGVNAGPAWIISAYKEVENEDNSTPKYTKEKPMVVAVIRSRGEHRKAAFVKPKDVDNGICEDVYKYDGIFYYAKDVKIGPSKSISMTPDCSPGYSSKTGNLNIDVNNYGTFTFIVELTEGGVKEYSVSLNPNDKNYIFNVIGGNPEIGDAEIYVEELYDVALKQLIERGELNTLGKVGTEGTIKLSTYNVARIIPEFAPVDDILTEDDSMLKRKDIGKRYLFSRRFSVNSLDGKPLTVYVSKDNGISWEVKELEAENEVSDEKEDVLTGHIFTVYARTESDGTRKYFYGEIEGKEEVLNVDPTVTDDVVENIVFVNADNMYYIKGKFKIKDEEGSEVEVTDVTPVLLDLNNYKEQYRYSSTPWVVSEVKGSAENIELTKLFRFHTISDGDNSTFETKISIENIDPELGTFDVLVRDFNDTDVSPVILERYKGVNLIPGSENYIALKIGSFDESYESKSKYITVEVNETDKTKLSVPCGFLGYPIRNYSEYAIAQDLADNDVKLQKPFLQYNTNIYDEIRVKKQYFGMSDLVGIDTDVLKYKGVEAYNDLPNGLTPCFHLDSRIFEGTPDSDGKVKIDNYEYDEAEGKYVISKNPITQIVNVDGVVGYEWVTVGKGNTVGNFNEEPRIGNEQTMMNTIYEDKRWRKFTMCFYGGWDGWDYYRTSRSNSDDFKYQRYRGDINTVSGESESFSVITSPETYGFDKTEKAITSDWYAYLSAIRQFANPKETDINVFATPGIDYVNNNLLVGEAIEMIEEERADAIYVITTPDKPFGAGDNRSEMYTAEEAVDNLEDSDIDSNWACTYYPWIKYFDQTNNQYIYLPPTKDVVRNFAYTDNVAAPWYAAAGWNRGLSDGVKSKKNLVLAEQDELYSGRINFVNNFAEEGMRIWGDNNLQVEQSAAHMNKISKRRCLIRLRKLISIACIGFVFDPNDNTLSSSFRSAIEPILTNMVSKRALFDAKLVIDDSEESRDKLELNAQIYLKFTPNAEYINIGLVATPQGVSFDDI